MIRGTGGEMPLTYSQTLNSDPGSCLAGDRVAWRGKRRISAASGALPTVRENPRERLIRTPGRTHNRISALNVKVEKFNEARVNGGSNYDSLKRNHSQGNGLGKISGERRPC
eukprot:g62645.t1